MAVIWQAVLLLASCFLDESWGHKDATDPHLVYPIRVDSNGHTISQDVTSKYHSSDIHKHDRVKRNTDQDKLYIVINNDNEELFLKLSPNKKLITPYTVIEWVLKDGRRILKHASDDCFYVGRLQNAERSLVAISNCDGLTGYIQTENQSYFIEPVKGSQSDYEHHAQPHLIYTVDSVINHLNLSLQQDQEYQHTQHVEEDNIVIREGKNEEDKTTLQLDKLFIKKRSAKLGLSRTRRSNRKRDIEAFRLKRRRRRTSSLKQEFKLLRTIRSISESNIPKFWRSTLKNESSGNRNRKFRTTTRRPKYHAERQSRSTSKFWQPKFFRFMNFSDENERMKRDGSSESNEEEPGTSQTMLIKERFFDRNENKIEEKSKRKSKKRNNNKKKKCRKRKKISKMSNSSDINLTEGAENQIETNIECKSRKSRRKLSKAEREKKKQERRERKKKRKEKKKLERERKKLLREKKKQERRKRRGKKNDVDLTVADNKEVLKFTNTTTSNATEIPDPFEGEDWDGYSPDLLWETDIAAGSSGLGAVSFGPRLNVSDPQKWLELVVAVDHTVIDFHGEDEVEKYVFTLFNIVSAIYEDPSLEANMELVMLRVIFYKDEAQSKVRKGLAKKYLEGVNRWAERLHRVSPVHLRHDIAVWLTKADLGGPSGYAPVAGVCQPSRSCTLNRDEGLTSAFIIAHEMGHVLGMSHDGDRGAGNTCQDEVFQGSVMAPLVAATFNRFHWSKCSKKEYHLRARNWNCMYNKPEGKNATMISSSLQYQYSLDDQCRMEFGEGYALCRSFGMTDPCTHLWCSNSSAPQLCKTKKGPPLEGTNCGEQKWCRNGFCESTAYDPEASDEQSFVRHNPQDGGWSEWSDWGPCSRTCGTGVAFKTRACDNPPPAWGGRRCRGKREEWKLCGTDECPRPHHDFRAKQCSLLNRIVKLDPRRAALTWQPYEPKKRRKKCRISCYSHNTNEVYIGREYVVDGTPCSYDSSDDICVQGKCIPVGCDKIVGSDAKRDQCGVCQGDGATCTHHNEVYHEIPPIDYSLVTVLPIGARNVIVREEEPTMNFIALYDNSSYLLNGGKVQEPEKSFITKGTKFTYTNQGEKEMLQAAGPLIRPITVMIHGSTEHEAVHLTASFYTAVEEEYFQWEVGPFTACSVTCGGGQKHETLICRDRRTDHQVFHDRCRHLSRPSLNTTDCNVFGCDTKWMTGPWEHCSATCGPNGVQSRVVSCVTLPDAHFKNWTNAIVDPIRCKSNPKPESTKKCRIEPCPAYWKSVGWQKCSVSCGVGEQEQLWECIGGGGNEVTYDCGLRPRIVRTCIKPPCSPPPCLRDASEFCQLPVLFKYCKVPKYNALCCHTCANVVH